MKITRISVLVRKYGTDLIYLYFDSPTTFPNTGDLVVATLEAQAGYGEEWVKMNFPETPLKVLNID